MAYHTFATPFVYDTNQNLVIATHNHSGIFYLNPISWRYHSTGAIQTFQWNNFGTIDPAAPSSYFTGSSFGAADVRFITNCTVSGCPPPFICRTDADSTSISVTWVAEGDDNPFVVQYRSAYATAYLTADGPLYDTTCTITGLNPATSYSIRVGTICDDDTLWNYINQTTNCGPLAMPYSEDFDSYAERVMPPCWTYNPERVDHLYGGISFNAQYATHSPSTRAAVLPPLADDLYTLEINFRARLGDASLGNGILIGVADNNGENISWLDTLTVANQSMDDYRWFNYSFADYDGDGGRIALSFLAPYNTLYGVSAIIDDITVSPISSCPAVTEFAVSNISDASAVTVSWNNPAQASQFQIAWDTIGTPLQLAANTVTVADTFYTLPQLVSGAKYSFYVSAVCPDEQSTWRSIDFAAGTIIMRTNADTTVAGCGLAIYDDGGTSHTITAVPTENRFGFTHWSTSAGDSLTDNPLTIYLTRDTAFVAHFVELPQYYLVAASNNEEWGTATGTGMYYEGQQATLTAVPAENYVFEGWTDGNEESPRIVTVTQDTVFEAIFAVDPTIGINQAATLEFSVSPNPTTGRLAVQLNQQEPYELTIYDVNGKAVMSRKNDNQVCEIDLGALAAGQYLLVVRTKDKYGVKTIVKK